MDIHRVASSLTRRGIPCEQAELRLDGTCPVLRTDQLVVKLFTDCRLDFDTELAAYRTLDEAAHTPRLIDHGHLEDSDYLVLSRASGHAVLDTTLTSAEQLDLAEQLGRTMKQLHDLPIDQPGGRLARDWLREQGPAAAQRHRAWQTLPQHLIDQIDDYLAPPRQRAFVHADLAVEHVFVDRGQLTSIIDWGGAEATDPHYELPILHVDLFGANKHLLRAFLGSYGWPDDDFTTRAMSAMLQQEFDSFEHLLLVRPDLDLTRFDTIDELAQLLWHT